jgi:hypothetical protein
MTIVDYEYRIYFLGGITSLYGIIRLVSFLPIYGAKCVGLKWNAFYPTILNNLTSILFLTVLSILIKLIFTPNTWLLLISTVFISIFLGFLINTFLILNKNERIRIFEYLSVMKLKLK